MSNPTTPFNWQMPQNTDLVTDLPADFEVFGQAVATSMQDLLGGTTGQVLAKASNADMDFVWSADAAGMTNPMTTTGDSIYSSSGSTPARLGIGSAGQVLTVTSGLPSWQTLSASGMTVISSGSLTGSSIDITGISGYNNLQLILKDFFPTTNGSSVRIRLNNNSTGTPYYKFWARDNNTTDITNSDNAWFLDNAVNGQLNSSTKTMCVLDIYDVTNTISDKMAFWNFFYTTTTSTDIQFYGNARYKNQSAITQVNIQCSSGNFGGGSYVLYGVK